MRRAALAFALALTAAAPAAAQDAFAGGAQAHFLASPQGALGAGVSTDLWYALEMFRFGGFFGVAAVPAEDDVHNRVFMPLGASIAFEALGDVVGVSLRARGGLWGGATQEVKLTAGGFLGGAAYMLFALGGGVAVDVGLEVWGIFGDGETVLFSPSAGLTWSPP